MTTVCCCCTSCDTTCIDMYGDEGSELNIIQIILKHLSFLTVTFIMIMLCTQIYGLFCFTQIAPNNLISPFICTECWLTIQNFEALYEKVLKLQDIKTNAYVEANNDLEDKSFKDPMNLDYHLINGTEGVFFNDTLNVLNEMKESQKVFQNDMEVTPDVTSLNMKLDFESPQVKENSLEEEGTAGFLDSTEFINDKPIRDYFNLECIQCCVKFKTFYEFKSHCKSVHKQKGRLKCCGKSFTCRFEVMQHISLHQNPEQFKYNA